MKYYEFKLDKPLRYNLTGKFKAPSPDWIHFARFMQDYELIVVTEGTVYIQSDQQTFAVGKGEYLLFSPSAKQAGFKKSSCAFYWLHFTCESSAGLIESDTLPEGQEDRIYLPDYGKIENPEKVIVMMKQLQDSVRSYHNNLHNNYVCTTILSELYSQLLAKENKENTALIRRQLFNDIQDYIKWNRNSDIKVSEIAEHFGYNRRYLSYLFNSIAGTTLKQYILQEKIELAKYLLCDTNVSISEIAYQIGFHDSHNFMKVFKKMVGLTPTRYRNAYSSRLLYYK